jgi:hypothetical protein
MFLEKKKRKEKITILATEICLKKFKRGKKINREEAIHVLNRCLTSALEVPPLQKCTCLAHEYSLSNTITLHVLFLLTEASF